MHDKKLSVVSLGVFSVILLFAAVFTRFAPVVLTPSPTSTSEVSVYVSAVSGDDTHTGSIDQPFKTLEKARNAIRTLNRNMSSDITVYLRGGRYELPNTLVLDAQDSGTNGHTVIYKNYQGETPIITGGKTISGWQQEGSKWKVFAGKDAQTRELYVNNVPAIRARSDGGLSGVAKTAIGYTTTDLTMQNWENVSDIEVIGQNKWKLFRCGVQGIVGDSIVMRQPCWNASQSHQPVSMGMPTWIENAFELLDRPGEWYLNRRTGWLYYMPRTGEDMTSVSVVMPRLETLIQGNGTIDAPIHNIRFEGLTFAEATWLRPNTGIGFIELQANAFIVADGVSAKVETIVGNVAFKFARNVAFDRNVFTRLGATGLSFGSGSQDDTVSGNRFYDIGGNALNVGSFDNPQTTDSRLVTKNITVSNNYIHTIAQEYSGVSGIWFGYAENSVIRNNELANLPYSGISIGWQGNKIVTVAKNNLIQANFIHDHMTTMFDGGGIYTHTAQPGTVISRNVITDQVHEYGALYLDDFSRYMTLSENIVFGNKRTLLAKGGDHAIHDNWWQVRDEDDLRFPPRRQSCLPTDCGSNTIQNNHVITALSQAPKDIIENAGLESAYADIKIVADPVFEITSAPLH